MGLDNLSPGKKVPDDINVVIEIPSNSSPVKYEVDKHSGMVMSAIPTVAFIHNHQGMVSVAPRYMPAQAVNNISRTTRGLHNSI